MLRFRTHHSLLISLSICLAVILLAGAAIIPFTDQVAAKDDSTKPTLPTPTLTAEINNNAVDINWTAVEGATYYKLYVSVGSTNTWERIGGDNITSTSFTHTDVRDGRTYKYSVIAANDSATSEASSYASVTMGYRLSASTLSAHIVTNGIELTWTPVEGAINYRLIVWDDVSQADKWKTVSGSRLTGSSYTHTDLTVGATYHYTIRAFGENGGRSPWAEQVSIKVMPVATEKPTPTPKATNTPLPPPTATPTATREPSDPTLAVPSQPQNLQAEVTHNYITLTWEASSGRVSGYQILRRNRAIDPVGQFTVIRNNTSVRDTQYIDRDISPDTQYVYRVKARNPGGLSEWSNYARVDVPAVLHAPTPTATFTPTPLPTATPTATPTHTPTPTPKATNTPLPPPTATPTATREPSDPTLAVPSQPQNLQAEVTHNYITLTWEASSGRVSGYQILRRNRAIDPVGQFTVIRNNTSVRDTQFIDRDILPDTQYVYRVKARNPGGLSEWSNYARVDVPAVLHAPTPTATFTPTPLPTATPTATPTHTPTPTPEPSGIDRDRAALMAIYNAAGGENWYWDYGWGSSLPLGSWIGVTTNEDGRVTRLRLETNLKGSLPSQIGDLSELKVLYIFSFYISMRGPIPPEIGNLSKLEELTLKGWAVGAEYDGFSGSIPPELGNLSNLKKLDLSWNDLSGSIPATLGSLSNLKRLSLQRNELSGSIPAELGNLSNLRELVLYANNLSGSIPAELGQITDLSQLHLSINNLSGEIPTELGNIDSPYKISLSGGNNRFTGCIPEAWYRRTLIPTSDGLHHHDFESLGIPYCNVATPTPVVESS